METKIIQNLTDVFHYHCMNFFSLQTIEGEKTVNRKEGLFNGRKR